LAKKKSKKDQKKLEDLKTKIEKQISPKEEIEIKKPKKRKERKKKKSIVRKKRARKVKDLLEHEYIPKHIILTEEEKIKLSEKYDCENLSHILISDPGIQDLEVKVGDVVKIKRYNEKVGDVFYYRLVVNE
jgi:DNA-directed RNA polymerase subunit H